MVQTESSLRDDSAVNNEVLTMKKSDGFYDLVIDQEKLNELNKLFLLFEARKIR